MIFGHYGRNVYIHPGVRFVRPRLMSIGDHVSIGNDSDLYVHPIQRDSRELIIQIGNHVHLGRNNIIGARKSVIIEDYVLLGPHVMIGDHSHRYENVAVPITLQETTDAGPIRIERDSWIGANVFILPRVNIGRHAVVGANSVVNRDVPAYSVVVGAPAKVVKRYDFGREKWVKVNE